MPKDIAHKQKHEPLYTQISKDASVEETSKSSREKRKKIAKETDFVDPKTSGKILKMIREQQDELSDKEEQIEAPPLKKIMKPVELSQDSDEEPEGDFEEWDQGNDLEIDEKDQELIEKFMNPQAKEQINVSIMSKLAKNNLEIKENDTPAMNPKVIDVYTKVGLLLSRYKSGPMPKTFKILPTLRDWEEVLYITNPAEWTPQALYQATRIFTSNLKSKMAQRFFNVILLEKVRNDIQETKKLNYHLYMAIKKSVYKPAAFFKGFLLPLCESGTCTLREAAIIGSVLVKISVPVLHSAAALLKLAEMEYSGSNSLFIRILLDKKYALPYKVIDSLVFHFLQFKQDDREMPVLWHQSFLVFAQRYKEDMTVEQKEALIDLLKFKCHHQITPEIKKELANSVCRGEVSMNEVEML